MSIWVHRFLVTNTVVDDIVSILSLPFVRFIIILIYSTAWGRTSQLFYIGKVSFYNEILISADVGLWMLIWIESLLFFFRQDESNAWYYGQDASIAYIDGWKTSRFHVVRCCRYGKSPSSSFPVLMSNWFIYLHLLCLEKEKQIEI